MSLERRLAQAEARVLGDGDEVEAVCYTVLYGFAPPKACADALLERDRRERPGLAFRWIDATAEDGKCSWCGAYHQGQAPIGEVLKSLGNVSARDI